MNYSHIPVLLNETITGLDVQPHEWYVDATLGGGGYTSKILQMNGKVLGIDADNEAITYVRQKLHEEMKDKQEGKDWITVQQNYRHIQEIVKEKDIRPRGIVFDLGVSSYQLDTPERGFSFRFAEAPLDLRLDQSNGLTAAQIVQTYSREELYEIFTKYGEEERSGAIVDAIISTRRVNSITTTGDLKEIISSVVPNGLKEEISARIFQALRIEVNDELQGLRDALDQAQEILVTGGRLCVVTFHSLEDRIVKQHMRKSIWKSIAKDPIRPNEREIFNNRRSRSAKLRIAEKK